MIAASPLATSDQGVLPIAERAAAILQDEIENGALTNIASARQRWPVVYRDLIAASALSRPADAGGLIGDVLDLLVPSSSAARASGSSRPQPPVGSLPILTAPGAVPPGGSTAIRTALQNDGPDSVEVSFVWSDLVAAPDSRIAASRLRLSPDRARVGSGASIDLTIVLDVPLDARAGIYRAVVQATAEVGPCALLTFPVGSVG